MADSEGGAAPAHAESATAWLGITIEIIAIIAILAIIVFGFVQPFNPTYVNLDYIFGKMLVFFQAIISFFVNYNVGTSIKIFIGLIVVFLIALNFYLFLRLLEMEEEHEEHAYHHADDPTRPHSLLQGVFNDAKEFASDTKSIFSTGAPAATSAAGDEFNKLMYWDEADLMTPTAQTGDATLKHEVDEKEGSSKWRMVLKHAGSRNPSDWKIAIIEADTILDALVERSGFPGATLGERLKNADRGVFKNLDYAWDAHKVRNRIAHEGTNFVLSERDAKKTIDEYEEVFKEFGYI